MVEKAYERLTLAKEQLDVALSLFLDHQSYASAITLAGAAEEIFGEALSLRREQNVLDWSFANTISFDKTFHVMKPEKKEYIDEENLARNALKHLQEDKGPTITVDIEKAACWMLVRALENAKRLGLEISRNLDFDNWFYENIVGV
ncbi:MAG: hypothetical protein WBQ69_07700 [Gallionella sp.]